MPKVLRISLLEAEKSRLEELKRASPDSRVVRRAAAILMSARGMAAQDIAAKLQISTQSLSNYRRRWLKDKLRSLEDRPRTGRPTAVVQSQLFDAAALDPNHLRHTSPSVAQAQHPPLISAALTALFIAVLGGGLFLIVASPLLIGRTPERSPRTDPRVETPTLRETVEQATRALKETPSDATLYARRAEARAGLARLEETSAEEAASLVDAALEDLDRAFALKASLPVAWWTRSEIHEWQALEADRRGDSPDADLRRAAEAVTAYIATTGFRRPALQRRAGLYVRIGEARIAWGLNGRAAFRDALFDLETIAKRYGVTTELIRRRGTIRLLIVLESTRADPETSDDLLKAIADLTEVIRRRPADLETYLERGRARQTLGDLWRQAGKDFRATLQSAEKDYDRVIEGDEARAWAYRKRGGVREALGNPRGALQDWQRAVSLRPVWQLELEAAIQRAAAAIQTLNGHE